MIVQAGFFQKGDFIRGRTKGELAEILGITAPYPPAMRILVRWENGFEEELMALPWDDFDLVAQYINSELDLEREP